MVILMFCNSFQYFWRRQGIELLDRNECTIDIPLGNPRNVTTRVRRNILAILAIVLHVSSLARKYILCVDISVNRLATLR